MKPAVLSVFWQSSWNGGGIRWSSCSAAAAAPVLLGSSRQVNVKSAATVQADVEASSFRRRPCGAGAAVRCGSGPARGPSAGTGSSRGGRRRGGRVLQSGGRSAPLAPFSSGRAPGRGATGARGGAGLARGGAGAGLAPPPPQGSAALGSARLGPARAGCHCGGARRRHRGQMQAIKCVVVGDG